MNDPSGASTTAYGISGNNIVGVYKDSNNQHGFLYNMTTLSYASLDDPFANASQGGTYALCISSNVIGGFYYDSGGHTHGFIYDMTTTKYTTVDYPLAVSTQVGGVDGANIVGYYNDSGGHAHGFIATPPPQLAINLSGANVILTWPAIVTGFRLQAITNLVTPSAWNTNLPAPVIIAGENTVTNPITGPQMFYRLAH